MNIPQEYFDFLHTHGDHIPVIVGATASGKSALGVALAHQLDGEVIVADARQCYVGMDCGTGKTTIEEMEGIPHHIQDSLGPTEMMTVGMFLEKAVKAIEEIRKKGKRPIVLGGTGLYIQALVEGYTVQPKIPEGIREEVEHLLATQGVEEVIRVIQSSFVDPSSLPHDLHNPRRATRVLELLRSGQSLYQEKQHLPYSWYVLGMRWPREVLRERIAKRHRAMFDQDALLHEYDRLLSMGYDSHHEAMTSIGYREVAAYKAGECSRDQAMEDTILHAQQYAKRQETWWRRMEKQVPIQWVEGNAEC